MSPDSHPMDVVLVNPPTTADQEFGLLSAAGAPRPPLNLLNLGASLLEQGYTVAIVDGAAMKGVSVESVARSAISYAPRYVGITAMTAFIHTAASVAERIRDTLRGIPVIVGGIHVSTLPAETMRSFPTFDVAVVGEGDITIVELIQALDTNRDLRDVPGLVFRDGEQIYVSARRPLIRDLDSLPLPAWHLLPDFATTYQPTMSRRTRLPSAYIVTSRGCPFRCSFCNNVVHGRTFRSYSVDRIMAMVDHMVQVYAVKDLTIYDENLALRRDRIEVLCARLIEANYDLTWSCDARADSVDEPTLELMCKAGCRAIWYGIESGNQSVLDRYNKGLTLTEVEQAVQMTRKVGIKACGSFIIGGPTETPTTILDTIRFSRRLRLDYFVPIMYTPIPGTPDYEAIASEGKVDLEYRHATMSRVTFAPKGMTFARVHIWYLMALLSHYVTLAFLARIVSENGVWGTARLGVSFVVRAAYRTVQYLLPAFRHRRRVATG